MAVPIRQVQPNVVTDEITLVDVLQQRAADTPDRVAFTFLLDGETQEDVITYRELDLRARAIAVRLQRLSAAGERVILLYPPGLEYIPAFLGCLYAGAVAVPTYPPDPFRLNRTLPRFRSLFADAEPAFVLTSAEILAFTAALRHEHADLNAPVWLATNEGDLLSGAGSADWQAWRPDPQALAFLQYTSGSTADPKGVMLTHQNLLHNYRMAYAAFDGRPDLTMVSWLPAYHDMGLLGAILYPLYAGFRVVLMSPLDFLQRPLRWLQAITRYRATHSGGPNFAYDLCVRKATPEKIVGLDLRSWQVAWNGAEPVRAQTLARFTETFTPAGFRATAHHTCYGLAEGTVMVTSSVPGNIPVSGRFSKIALAENRLQPNGHIPNGITNTANLVSSGRAWPGLEVRIIDPETLQPCAAGKIGEIWVTGDSVAQGYWRRPETTAQIFRARPVTEDAGSDRPYLRTGDLGFMLDGELFITGRLKDLIIIDGRNHYPQDIEITVEQSHPALRPGCSAAFSLDQEKGEQVVILAEMQKPQRLAALIGNGPSALADEVKNAIRRAVTAGHDLRVQEVVLLRPGTIPKTSSGKIRRQASRQEYLAVRLETWPAVEGQQ